MCLSDIGNRKKEKGRKVQHRTQNINTQQYKTKMSKVYITENRYLSSKLSAWVIGEMKIQGISQSQMAKQMGISQQALSRKLNKYTFSFEDFLDFVKILKPQEIEIIRLVKGVRG